MINNKEILKKIKENPYLLGLFFISTAFLLYQHNVQIKWDFSAYILNAKYLFYNGNYFEVYRAPMTSIFLGIFLIFGKFIAGYILIIFTSTLFFIGNIHLSKYISEKFNHENFRLFQFLFYFFSLSIFVLKYATQGGSEMLGLAFFQIFILFLLKGRLSGHILALAFLTRYNFLLFFPLLLINRSIKKIIKNVSLFCIVIFPWFLYNYLKFGNYFASFIDSYAFNVLNRQSVSQPFQIIVVLKMINWFLPIFLIGLIYTFYLIKKSDYKWNEKSKIIILFLIIFIGTIFDFYSTPFKIERYLYNLSLPLAFFSTLGSIVILKYLKIKDKHIIIICIILMLIFSGFLAYKEYESKEYFTKFHNAVSEIERLNLQECKIFSPHWMLINLYTENTYPLKEPIKNHYDRGEIVLLFQNEMTIDDGYSLFELELYNKISQTKDFILIAKHDTNSTSCIKKSIYDQTYSKFHCDIISNRFKRIHLDKISLKICNKVNNI